MSRSAAVTPAPQRAKHFIELGAPEAIVAAVANVIAKISRGARAKPANPKVNDPVRRATLRGQ